MEENSGITKVVRLHPPRKTNAKDNPFWISGGSTATRPQTSTGDGRGRRRPANLSPWIWRYVQAQAPELSRSQKWEIEVISHLEM